jgi:hypothetical protein
MVTEFFLFGQLAQLDRALASGAKGRRFESCIARQIGIESTRDVVAGAFLFFAED